jgi:hypothetical protein
VVQCLCLNPQTIGLISGALVLLSIVPYAIRTYQGKIHPVPTSWLLWSLIGLAILITYRSAGANANIWPAVFAFTNPTLVTFLSVWRGEKWKRPNLAEVLCLLFGLASLILWMVLRRNPELAQYALYVAIIADFCAAIPTVRFVWMEPARDRPLAWLIYGAGYFLAIFATPQNTLANWGLPLYMTAISFTIALPLILHRVRRNIPLKEWA